MSDDDDYEPEYEPERLTVAERFKVEFLALVPPPLEYMATLHSNEEEISGRQIWCGSLLLAHCLVELYDKDPNVFKDKRILELGSGTGLVGMVVSKLGRPQSVVLTDGDPEAMDLLQQNLNNPHNQIDAGLVRAELLRWGETASSSQPSLSPEERFDFILAGDVMYKKELPSLFFQTVHERLTHNGTLWLCHVPRSSVTQQVVLDAAENSGFQIQKCNPPQIPPAVQEAIVGDDLERACLYRITQKETSNR